MKKNVLLTISLFLVLVMSMTSFMACSNEPEPSPAPSPSPSPAPAASTAPDTIKVGASLALTGKYASGGKDIQSGYKMLEKHVNEAGGIYIKEYDKKIPLEIIIYDDESDPTKAISRLEKMKTVDNVVAYLGNFASGMNVAEIGIAEKNSIPIVCVTLTPLAPMSQGYKYVFRPFTDVSIDINALFDFYDSLGNDKPKNVAYWELQEDWGKEAGEWYNKVSAEHGYTVATYEKYAPSTTDFSSLILSCKGKNVDAIYTNPTPPQVVTLMKQLKELDYMPKLLLMQRGPDLSGWWETMGEDAQGVISCSFWDESFDFPGNAKLVEDYLNENPKLKASGLPVGMPVGGGYHAAQILVDAIERAGTLDSDAIRDAIASTDMVTVRGPIKFKADGNAILSRAWRQWQDGKQNVVYPAELAEAPLQFAVQWSER